MPFGCFGSRAPPKSSTTATAAAEALPHGDEVATSTITQRQNASILGLLVGDAAGAVLEFSGGAITAAKADRALTMPGGGIWRVGPGQITDDGELALCLLQALRKFDPLSFDPVAVTQESARMYSAWFKSQPFDMGQTCGQAFGVHRQVEEGADLAAAMVERASKTSQANGALMRSAPIPAWLAGVDDQDKVIICARNDALLSHAHPACQDCNVAYCLAIWHLIRNPGDREGAIQRATLWAESHGGNEVKQWLQLSKAGDGIIDAAKDIGHVKWAFLLAFQHLRNGSSVQDGIHATLLKGGDTDTNAAIVGAMLGALHGAVPPHLTAPVLAYKTGAGRPRPAFLTPSCVLKQGVAFPARRPGGSNGGSNNKLDSGQQ